MLNNTDLLIHSVFIYFLLLFTYLDTFVFRQRLIFYWVLPRLFHPLIPCCHPNPSIPSQTSPKDHTAFISGKPLPVASRVVLAKPLAKHARLTSHRIAMAKCWLLPPVRDLGELSHPFTLIPMMFSQLCAILASRSHNSYVLVYYGYWEFRHQLSPPVNIVCKI